MKLSATEIGSSRSSPSFRSLQSADRAWVYDTARLPKKRSGTTFSVDRIVDSMQPYSQVLFDCSWRKPGPQGDEVAAKAAKGGELDYLLLLNRQVVQRGSHLVTGKARRCIR